MDIARPEFKEQKRRRQIMWAGIGLASLIAVTIGVTRLKPAAPEVERSTVWTDTVKRGPMLRQVRGIGSLITQCSTLTQGQTISLAPSGRGKGSRSVMGT